MTCNRCGTCCKLIIKKDGKEIQSKKDCNFLIRLKSGRTLCRIYRNRLGKSIGTKEFPNHCVLRENSAYDFIGCPYNTNKPVISENGVIAQTEITKT